MMNLKYTKFLQILMSFYYFFFFLFPWNSRKVALSMVRCCFHHSWIGRTASSLFCFSFHWVISPQLHSFVLLYLTLRFGDSISFQKFQLLFKTCYRLSSFKSIYKVGMTSEQRWWIIGICRDIFVSRQLLEEELLLMYNN